jgi:hypothetical protein
MDFNGFQVFDDDLPMKFGGFSWLNFTSPKCHGIGQGMCSTTFFQLLFSFYPGQNDQNDPPKPGQ